MTDTPNRQTVVVGLFVSFAVALLAGGILTVGNINDTFTRKIEVTAVFPEVGGLQVGDNVWFSGLKVGTVKHLEFHGSREVEVDMRVDRDAAAWIPRDALAKISSDGLIGNKIVVIYQGTAGGPLIEDGAQLAAGESVSTEDMKAMLQQNNANLLAITQDLKGMTARLAAGDGSLGKLLADDTLYPQVTATVSSLQSASTSAKELTASLATFSAKLNEPGHLPNDLATDQTLFASISSSVEDLRAVTTKASALAANLERASADPNSALGTLTQDPTAGADLRTTISNLKEGSRLLNEDLDALQHNVLLRGYFKKKEKDAPTPEVPAP